MRNKLFFLVLLLVASQAVLAQDPTVNNAGNIGVPPNGMFTGSDFESVQLNNGNLHIETPIWGLKGRGLNTFAKFVYDSAGWGSGLRHCSKTGDICTESIIQSPGSNLQLKIKTPFSYRLSGGGGHAGPAPSCSSITQHSNYTVQEPNGTKHHFLPDPAYSGGFTGALCGGPLGTMYADDGSGWIMRVDPTGGAIQSAVSKDGTVVYPTTFNSEDANGNLLYNGTDTLGRTVSTDGSYYDSSGVLRTLAITYQNVTVQTNMNCSDADVCNQYSNTWSVPHIIQLPNGSSYTIEYVQGQYGQPSSITVPTGGQISWTWGGVSLNEAGPMVITRTETASGQSSTWTYNAFASTNTTVTDPLGNDTVTSFACVWPSFVDQYFNPSNDPPCYPTMVKYYQGRVSGGTLLKTVQTDYATNGAKIPIRVTTTWNQTNLVSKTETDYDSLPIPNWTSDSFTWGNPTEYREFDWGAGAAGALVRKTDSAYLHQSNTTYRNLNIADRVTVKSVYDGASALKAQTVNTYDSTAVMSDLGGATNRDGSRGTSFTTRGNVTSVQRWLNPGNSMVTVATNNYDDLGNLRSSTDALNHTTTYSYANNFLNMSCLPANSVPQAYLYQTTNALGQNTQASYDGCTGLPFWKRDQNDINAGRFGTSFTYDSVNRPLTVNYPDSGQTIYSYVDTLGTYGYLLTYHKDLICNSTASASCPTGTSLYAENWKQFDALGRVSRVAKTNGESPGIDEAGDTCYDALGRKSFARYPYADGGWATNSYPCANSSSSPGDTFAYDALSRPTSITNTDGSVVTTSYSGNWTTVCDQAGRCRKSATDALGRLTTVCEPDPATGVLPTGSACTYETDYQYDTLDNLTRVDQKGNDPNSGNWRTRTFSYDSFSRLLSATNPESGTICYGVWSGGNCINGYDADGNLLSKTAPAPNQTGTATVTTNYSYDQLHRSTQVTYSNSSDAKYFSYDSASIFGITLHNPVGRLVLNSSFQTAGSVATYHSYEPMGRLEFELHQNFRSSNAPYQQFSYNYNLDGSLNIIQYPSGHVVGYAYNVGQRPASVADSSTNYVTNGHYTAWGALASLVNGNTITTSNSYNSRMQPSFLTASTSMPSATVLSLGYDFHLGAGDNSNVYQLTNNRDTTRNQTFTYDYLNRLTSGQSAATSGSNCWGESFAYDMWANLNSRIVTKCSAEGPVPAAMNNNRMATYPYDSAGNYWPTSYTYDAENRLTAAAGLTFDYDADGRRVKKSNGTLYWYGANGEVLEETNLSGTLTNEYVFFGGKRIARRNDGSYLSSATMQNASLSQANALDQPCACGPYNLGPIPGWTSGGTGPTGSWQPNTASYNAPLPGIVVLSNSGTISQTLTTPFQPNTTYTLLVDIGKRLEAGLTADYSLTLQAGSTVLATLRASNGAVPAGSFQTESLTYTSPSSPPAGNITIVLQSYGVQVNFKNVRLNLSTPSTVHYYFSDHLGSTDLVTDALGTMSACPGNPSLISGEEESDYYPFGGERVLCDRGIGNNYKFTGKERDTETGLDEFGARYYSSFYGRFTIPDWAAAPTAVPYAKFGDPQSLNLYSYVENAPVNRADPDGHEIVGDGPHGEVQFDLAQSVRGMQVVTTIGSFAPGPFGRISGLLNAAINTALGNRTAGLIGLAASMTPGGKLTKAEQMLKNAATGKAAEKAVEQTLAKEGAEVVGKQVSVQTSNGLRRVDFLTKNAEGQLTNIEAKSANAERTASQVAKDNEIGTQGGKYVGKNAPQEIQGTTQTVPTQVKKPD